MEKLLRGQSMWVVKIGGSLLGSPELERWLAAVAKYGDGKIIIVPGGGVFADAVRAAQKLSKISDTCAHKLAVLAMDQLGLLLTSMNPALATASTPMEIDERSWQHRGIVWLPSKMVLADESIPQNWHTTSDSIAAWLTKELGAKHLILVKSDKPNDKELKLKDVTEAGLIDARFGDYVLDKAFSPWIMRKTDYVYFDDGMDEHKLIKAASLIQ